VISAEAARAHAAAGRAYAIVKADDPYFDRLAGEIRGIILRAEQGIYNRHARQLVDSLLLGRAGLNDALANLMNGFRDELGDAVTDACMDRVLLAYTRGTVDVLGTQRFELNQTDQRALGWLRQDTRWWVGEYWSPDFATEISDVMAPAFLDGTSPRDLQDMLASQMGDRFSRSSSYWRGFATNVTTRARAFGLTEGAVRAGFTKGTISAIRDDITSEICRTLDGQTVLVSDMVKLREGITNAPNPDAIREIAPWRTSAEEVENVRGEIAATGNVPEGLSLPPYHFHCRTTVVFS
jgi:hypothetical protein